MDDGFVPLGKAAERVVEAPYSLKGRRDASSKWKDRKPSFVSIHARPKPSTV